MAPVKAFVLGDPFKMNSFVAAQTYLQNFVSSSDAHRSMQRQVSGVEHEGKHNASKKRHGRNNGKPKFYSKEEWWGLDDNKRQKIQKIRYKNNKSFNSKKRKISKAKRENNAAIDARIEEKAKVTAAAETQAEANAAKAAKAQSAGEYGTNAYKNKNK
jgi:hypothetical protein